MTKHFLFDVEALAKKDSGVILAIAGVVFEFDDNKTFDDYLNSKDSFFVKIDSKSQIADYKRTVDSDTINWWKTQPLETKKMSLIPSSEDVSFEKSFTRMNVFLEDAGYDHKRSYLWSRGSGYDFPKIESALEQLGMKQLNSWKVRDTRTYIDILAGVEDGMYNLKTPLPESFTKHHCLHDAIKEVLVMTELFRASMS